MHENLHVIPGYFRHDLSSNYGNACIGADRNLVGAANCVYAIFTISFTESIKKH